VESQFIFNCISLLCFSRSDVRQHIETYICNQIHAFTRALGPLGPDWNHHPPPWPPQPPNLDNSTTSFSSTTSSLFSNLPLKFATLRFLRLEHMGLDPSYRLRRRSSVTEDSDLSSSTMTNGADGLAVTSETPTETSKRYLDAARCELDVAWSICCKELGRRV